MEITDEELKIIVDCLHFTIKFGVIMFGKPSDGLLDLYKRLSGEEFDPNEEVFKPLTADLFNNV